MPFYLVTLSPLFYYHVRGARPLLSIEGNGGDQERVESKKNLDQVSPKVKFMP